ncbi:AraC family transcriptional regulator [Pontibacter sp. G13]|uniref:AraC family transcriptional regulator n=1 Tax=Pontibacter sp. G13 TaxID=3074898 RepID=UPI00288C1833|nr:AraC family transcriptional regulator [Pontibacter sp. G13]WNJ17295.1 AraC family transcriptional regulator [Pontibacter sp. G13]
MNTSPIAFPQTEDLLVYTRTQEVRQSFFNDGVMIVHVIRGTESIRVGHRSYSVQAGQYLIVNPKEHIQRSSNASSGQVESILLFLRPERIMDQLRALDWSLSSNLGLTKGNKWELCEHVYDMEVGPFACTLRKLSEDISFQTYKVEQQIEGILEQASQKLVEQQMAVFHQLDRLNCAKLSTRMELYRRLSIAKGHIHAHLDEPLDLDTLSQVACLSKYHFIRLFKEVYEQTPRQYLIARRLERASSLLIHSSKTFHEICHEVGLKDSSSFGRLFKRNFGATPQIYRQMHAAS